MVKSKVALEERTIGVEPFAARELSIFEGANILLTCLKEDVSALTVLLSVCPVAGVNILIEVSHDTLTMAVTTFPVSVVLANLCIHLFADTVLLVVNPGALVLDWLLIGALGSVGVISLTVAFL